MKKVLSICALVVVVSLFQGCNESLTTDNTADKTVDVYKNPAGTTFYLKYNLHYVRQKGKIIASIANITKCPGHQMVKYGTPVTIKIAKKYYTVTAGDRVINVLWSPKFRAGMSQEDYLKAVLSTEPVEYTGFSDIDKKGIEEGVPYVGMSKTATMVALGYPIPLWATPSSSEWYYWKNRFSKYVVHFTDDKISSIEGY